MPTVLCALQILPLREDTLVGLHLRSCLGPLKTIATELSDQVIEDQRIGTLRAVFWQNTDEQQVDNVCLMPFQNLQ